MTSLLTNSEVQEIRNCFCSHEMVQASPVLSIKAWFFVQHLPAEMILNPK